MFKQETLAAYGCVKNTVRSTKKATLLYALLITVFHALLLYFPDFIVWLLPEQAQIDKSIPSGYLVAAVFGFLIFLAVFIAVCSGYRNYALAVSRSSQACFSDTLAPFRSPLRSFAAALLITLFLTAAAALAVLGAMVSVLLFALDVFCIIYVLCMYRPLWFVLYDKPELSLFHCFRQTRRLTRGKRKDLFLFDLYFLWFPLLASLLPYFIFAIPMLSVPALAKIPDGIQAFSAFLLGEIFSVIIYVWKFDYVSTAYACYYNEICEE
ncbi:MAG: hypothetical protein MJ085_05400 [Clostridia bacterium]|nr:hypothetical protein [Clostridia bacterium]